MIQPGSTIGVFGSGQLGRMFVHAAQRMGYRVHIFSPEADTPAGQAADLEITASYHDREAVRAFARRVDVVTLEFENIPLEAIDEASAVTTVHPGRHVIAAAQNRIAEKQMLTSLGLPVAAHRVVESVRDIEEFVREAAPHGAVLKSATAGYDGKGQAAITDIADARGALAAIGSGPAIVEEFVNYEAELSVIAARSVAGDISSFGPVANTHRHHILDISVAPATDLSPDVRAEAIDIAESLMESLDVVGVLCVEFFLASDGRLLINEIAPRPHNSGHLTIEAAATSQFEQQVRAVCGLPLGSMELLRPAAMANLLGQHIPTTPDAFSKMLAMPHVSLHLYGKSIADRDRKMGHITATANSAEAAISQVRLARSALANGGVSTAGPFQMTGQQESVTP